MRYARVVLVLIASCGGTTVAGPDTTPNSNDASVIDAAQESMVGPDAALDASAEAQADAALEAKADVSPPCDCPADQVWRSHECVPTSEIGCGPACDLSAPSCPDGYECTGCAASSTCATKDCRATCVFVGPLQGPIDPGDLRISPTLGSAGQGATIVVSGYPFYIGALMYGVRLGTQDVWGSSGGGTCSFEFKAPAMAPGMVAVRVSQYGPSAPWIVAGFFTYSAGDIPDCVQPGYPCTQSSECCATVDAPMGCVGQRCMEQ